MNEAVLSVSDLQTHLHTDDGIVRAVDGLSFEVDRNETVCLVGESGSGKTMACNTITGMVGPPAEINGEVRFDGQDLLGLSESELTSVRGNRIAYLFQNAQNALDPVYTIGDQIAEAITFHQDTSSEQARERAVELLATVGLSRPAERVDEYPHELSDGMCQRVAIAIALAAEPDLLIADEPVSALDVMIQGRIIDLLDDLREKREFSLVLVTHDLRVVASLADRIVVLYGGTDVERGAATDVLQTPAHPYSQDLFESFTGDGESEDSLASRDPIPPQGCRFHRECRHAVDDCRASKPPFAAVDGNESHRAACVYYGTERDPGELLFNARHVGAAFDSADEPPGQTAETDGGDRDE
ncbi:peptide/nickel transport system ATP-binding protein [Halovenus aranensis]|jgi:peptide/nickel transport system ATP-binding protein|uniref:Nickel import system ATP-binding protein NikD n=1 Tax=Halovenus aranensis TaxID=890420 RepID=A0A1G8YKV6_9EURY|nr:ABC transporter ATP-binding protein [Halovenus aranensis]SDK03428.1 peptide/nickel transport system ATP-binding protein [Halovenus aranensis]